MDFTVEWWFSVTVDPRVQLALIGRPNRNAISESTMLHADVWTTESLY
jgi:hypothetical protein